MTFRVFSFFFLFFSDVWYGAQWGIINTSDILKWLCGWKRTKIWASGVSILGANKDPLTSLRSFSAVSIFDNIVYRKRLLAEQNWPIFRPRGQLFRGTYGTPKFTGSDAIRCFSDFRRRSEIVSLCKLVTYMCCTLHLVVLRIILGSFRPLVSKRSAIWKRLVMEWKTLELETLRHY